MLRFAFFLRIPVLLFLVHAYVATRLFTGLPIGPVRIALLVGVVIMYLIILTGFMIRHDVSTPKTDKIAWVSFLFLGLFSWLFVLTLLRDLALLFSFGSWHQSLKENGVWVVLGGSFLAVIAGLFNARRTPAVANVKIAIPSLPPELEGLTIAQITDLHVGPTIKKSFVKKIVDATNALNADIIVLTGDLIDGDVNGLREHTNELAALNAPLGVFAVTGNHEYYSGADQWITEYQRLGMRVLQNEHVVIHHNNAKLALAGVNDFSAGHFRATQGSDPKAALAGCPAEVVKILLAHQPRSMFAAEPVGFDLQISGHTHGGQFWPWGYFVPLQQPLVAGLHTYGNMQVYVSKGTGYWGPPLRLGAKSEISLLNLSYH